MAGFNLRTLQQLPGHKTLQTVVRHTHLSQSHELAAVERLCKIEESAEEQSDTTSDTAAEDADINKYSHVTDVRACSSTVRAEDS